MAKQKSKKPRFKTGFRTIGIHGEEGEFAVFATLNNETFRIPPKVFEKLTRGIRKAIKNGEILEREDAPTTVWLED